MKQIINGAMAKCEKLAHIRMEWAALAGVGTIICYAGLFALMKAVPAEYESTTIVRKPRPERIMEKQTLMEVITSTSGDVFANKYRIRNEDELISSYGTVMKYQDGGVLMYGSYPGAIYTKEYNGGESLLVKQISGSEENVQLYDMDDPNVQSLKQSHYKGMLLLESAGMVE